MIHDPSTLQSYAMQTLARERLCQKLDSHSSLRQTLKEDKRQRIGDVNRKHGVRVARLQQERFETQLKNEQRSRKLRFAQREAILFKGMLEQAMLEERERIASVRREQKDA